MSAGLGSVRRRTLSSNPPAAQRVVYDDNMGQSPTRRRWLRFSLRGLLIVVTLVAVWLGWNVHVVRQRKAALAELRSSGKLLAAYSVAMMGEMQVTRLSSEVQVTFVRKLLGDDPMAFIYFSPSAPISDLRRAKVLFPEADVTSPNSLGPDHRTTPDEPSLQVEP